MASFSVQYIFSLQDKFSAIARVIAANSTKMKAAIHAAGAAMATLSTRMAMAATAFGVLAAAMTLSAIPAAAKFEDAMAGVRRVTDITRQEMLDYGKDALKVGVEVAKGGEDIAAIYMQGALMGVRGQEALADFARTVSKVGVVWDDIGDKAAASGLASIQAKFFADLAPEEATKRLSDVADAMNELSNRSPFKAPELLKFMETAAAAGRRFGLSGEQLAAFGGTSLVADQASGLQQATRAIMTFTKLQQAAAKPMKKQREAIRALGYTQEEFAGKLRNNPQLFMLDFLERLSKMDKLKQAGVITDLMTIKSMRQMTAMAGNINEYKRQLVIADDAMAAILSKDKPFMEWLRNGAQGHKELADQIDRYGRIVTRVGSVDREFGKRTETLMFAGRQLGIAWDRIVKLVGMPYLEPMRKFANALTDISLAVGDWIAKNESLVTTLSSGGMIAGLIGAGSLLLQFATYATGAASSLALLSSIASGVITFTIAAVTIGWLWNNFDKVLDFFKNPKTLLINWPEPPKWLEGLITFLQSSQDAERKQAEAAKTTGWATKENLFRMLGIPYDAPPSREWLDQMGARISAFNVPALPAPPSPQSGPPLPGANPNRIPAMQVESRVDVSTSFQPATVNVTGQVDLSGAFARIYGQGQLQANRGVASAEAGTAATQPAP